MFALHSYTYTLLIVPSPRWRNRDEMSMQSFANCPTPTCYPMLMCPALLPTFCDNEHSSLVGLPRPTKHFVLAQIRFSIVATYRKESIVSQLMSVSIPNLGDDNLSNPFAFSFSEPSETLCRTLNPIP